MLEKKSGPTIKIGTRFKTWCEKNKCWTHFERDKKRRWI